MWFRDDLRLHDNAALTWAAERGPVIGVVVDEDPAPGTRPVGAAAAWWRELSLAQLADALSSHGVPLVRLAGDARKLLPRLAAEHGVTVVSWTRRYHQPWREVDAELKAALKSQGIEVASHPGATLVEPWEVTARAGDPFRVYTPFARAARDLLGTPGQPLPVPCLEGAHTPGPWRRREDVLRPAWTAKLAAHWTPGEAAARARLAAFGAAGEDAPQDYAAGRDFPARQATSRLSPHLRFGEVSPREVWTASAGWADGEDALRFQSELLWRDFAWHRLYQLPDLATRNVRAQFDRFDWAWEDPHLQAWQRGETGYGLVDAGMRELWETGYMHNRVRMVVASFLTKNLGIHWRRGEEWFWDTLVDADAASNPFNWQWVAGSGDDAAPFFRVFNPETQAKRFDPQGEYVARWAGPLSPPPVVDLRESRLAALEAWEATKTD